MNIITESDQKQYAIAIPFVDEENLLFQVRSDKLGHQPGDISFPGGAVEDGEVPEEAVIRELSEELLLSGNQIEIQEEICLLVNDTAVIHCFPCRIYDYAGGFNREEVAEVFRVPICFLRTRSRKSMRLTGILFFRRTFRLIRFMAAGTTDGVRGKAKSGSMNTGDM